MKMNFNFNKHHALQLAISLALFLSAMLACISSLNAQTKKIHLGLIYPLSSNGRHAALDTNDFSLNLLAGVSAGERGLSVAGLSNIIKHDANGLQIAGFSNHIGGAANGALFAGFLNTYGKGKGPAFAGFANIAKASGSLQVAGFLNRAGNVSFSQLAGFINVAKEVKGSQFAGFINVAGKVKGVQIAGFMNVADSSDYPIGIINLVKNGEKSISVTTDENLTTLLSFRSGGKVLYGIIGLGYNFENKKEVYAMEAGLGAHLLESDVFRLSLELATTTLESFKAGEYFKSSFRALPSFKLTRSVEIFGGPSFNYVNTNTSEGRNLTGKYITTWERNHKNDFQGIYIGYMGGIQVLF